MQKYSTLVMLLTAVFFFAFSGFLTGEYRHGLHNPHSHIDANIVLGLAVFAFGGGLCFLAIFIVVALEENLRRN
jgi:hypothetical protein